MTYGLLWFCLPAAVLGYVIAAIMHASGRVSEREQAEADMGELAEANAELTERLDKTERELDKVCLDVGTARAEAHSTRQSLLALRVDNTRLTNENGVLALKLAELTAKNSNHAQIPARPRRSPVRISTSQPTGEDGERP